MDFDEDRLYYSHQQLQTTRTDEADAPGSTVADDSNDDGQADLEAVRRHFKEFLRNYRLGQQRYLYREKLLRMHRRLANSSASGDDPSVAADAAKNANTAKLEVDLAHVGEYDAALLGFIIAQPATLLPALEQATVEALRSLLYSNNNNNRSSDMDPDGIQTEPELMVDSLAIQVLLRGNLKPTPLRSIHSEHINKLLKCPGIVISTSPVKNRAVKLVVRCQRCLHTRTILATDGPFGSVTLPMVCSGPVDPEECGRYPYAVSPDQSQFVDQQTLKLQEAPERVPTGEMPRSILMAVERSLVDVAPPGTRVSVLCIPTLFTAAAPRGSNSSDATKQVYLRVVGMVKDNDAHGQAATFTPQEEEAFQALSRHANVYDILQRSIAPDISGSYTVDIKKALACQLFGGSCKKLPDGVRLRGDINCLLLGDPSMAKSQFLKSISKISPVGIYTSGKGSSAAGLTASVVRDAKGEFYLEGGAMVLADGGVVCIDEFDKMRPNDRVAIHEAMEQQTISIAKAGITTVLNARASVLAAANPVFGRYDDARSASENIDLMTTILSRFDLIFLVRDIREEERDRLICQHVMGVHINNSSRNSDGQNYVRPMAGGDAGALSYMDASSMPGGGIENGSGMTANSPEAIADNILDVVSSGNGELSNAAMKKYIQYCKAKCSPRLTDEAGEILTSSYVKIRDDVRKQAISARSSSGNDDNQAAIPITVRQLEALVRLSESLAKMRLESEVAAQDVTEALRLFRVSTMAANAVDHTSTSSDASLSVSAPNRQEMERTEAFLRSRLVVGGMMLNKQRIIEEAVGQGFNAVLVARALSVMVSRDELMERNQGRLLKRVR
ncbi:hypothetical protein MPSEU_001065500 [Mayamaea pseudoterrestris]|nr:hypothetical protein MPSEU_001065500 [Mayamaea pseudoterrestris]